MFFLALDRLACVTCLALEVNSHASIQCTLIHTHIYTQSNRPLSFCSLLEQFLVQMHTQFFTRDLSIALLFRLLPSFACALSVTLVNGSFVFCTQYEALTLCDLKNKMRSVFHITERTDASLFAICHYALFSFTPLFSFGSLFLFDFLSLTSAIS